MTLIPEIQVAEGTELHKLESVDWAFTKSDTSYLTHDFHPYPAKFL
jgi:hypothetical protein